jgi:hypothetical protein
LPPRLPRPAALVKAMKMEFEIVSITQISHRLHTSFLLCVD